MKQSKWNWDVLIGIDTEFTESQQDEMFYGIHHGMGCDRQFELCNQDILVMTWNNYYIQRFLNWCTEN